MSNIKDEDGGLNAHDILLMNKKRIVFIVDEAHRSTFGDMLRAIKNTFTSAIFFGFTGTPIQDENQKKMNTTSTVFGDEFIDTVLQMVFVIKTFSVLTHIKFLLTETEIYD